MSVNGWLQFAIYSIILLAIVRPAGIYMARVIEGERTWLDPVLRPFERLIYKLCGVRADKEMNWREYTFAMLGFAALDRIGEHLALTAAKPSMAKVYSRQFISLSARTPQSL